MDTFLNLIKEFEEKEYISNVEVGWKKNTEKENS